MAKQLRIGILGGGGIVGAHATGYSRYGALGKVVAIAEPVAEKEGRLRELFGDEFVMYDDYESLLREAEVDAVDIVLPHQLHEPATVAAAKAGKHVLVEKVMGRTVAECQSMVAACEAAGVSLVVCHDRRYDPAWVALKRVVDSGILGEIAYWKLDHNQDVSPMRYGIPWACSKELLGGGAIMSCLTHQIDALRWYGGEVASVSCVTQVVPERMEGETCGAMVCRMASGAMAHLSINWMTRMNREVNGLYYEMVQVCGDKGEAFYVDNRGTWVLPHDDRDPSELVAVEPREEDKGFWKVKVDEGGGGHAELIGEWLKMLRGEANTVSTWGHDSLKTVAVAEAAYASEESGVSTVVEVG